MTAGIGILVAGIVILFGASAWQKFRCLRADADKKELEASLIQSGDDMWIKEKIKSDNGRISIEYARLGGMRLRVNSHDHNPTQSEMLYAQTLLTTGQSKIIANGQLSINPPIQLDLLSLLDKAERVLIKGASDAGKTTLLQHVCNRSNGVFVIDPHYAPGIWPVSANRIVGAARNYQSIDIFLVKLIGELNNRYTRRARGENNFEQITLIIDEFNSIRQECDHAGKILSTLIRESRKVGFRLFIGSHSELVKPLGLEGQGDIREGLLIVRLEIDQINKQRRATIDMGKGEQECYFPPFNGIVKSVVPDLIIQPTDEETKILNMASEGSPYHAISQEVWGVGKIGSFYNRKIDLVLQKHGIEVRNH